MASENLKQKNAVKVAATEKDISAQVMSMQDRIKLDNKLGKLTSTEKAPKKGDKKLVGPN